LRRIKGMGERTCMPVEGFGATTRKIGHLIKQILKRNAIGDLAE
jgi:hypothetical protein